MTRTSPPSNSRGPLDRHGPFTRLLFLLHLAPTHPRKLTRFAALTAAALWSTFAICSLVDRVLTGKIPLLFEDLSAHVRILVSIPALLLAETMHIERSAYVMDRLSDGGLVDGSQQETVSRTIGSAERLRHSRAIEYACWALGFSFGLAVLRREFGVSDTLRGLSEAATSGVAYVWYVLLVIPVYGFLFSRAVWRWLVWSRLLFQVSRIDLKLTPTHPDRAGGLGFVSEPVSAAAVVGFAVSAGMITRWRALAQMANASIREFAPKLAVLLAAALVLAIGPLLFFGIPAFRARLNAEREHSRLVLRYVQQVHAAWFEGQQQPESPIGVFDSSSMADIDSTYQNLVRMRIVPVEPKMLIAVTFGITLPFGVAMAAEIPLKDLLRAVGHALTQTLF
jgi:hypothetical protein